MNHRWLLRALALPLLVSPLAAQQTDSAVTMAAGKYTIEARDTTKAFPPIPFELKGNGNWVISMEGGTFSGKLKITAGTVTYSDQGCVDDSNNQREGIYALQSARGGFWFAVKSDPCEGRGPSLAEWLFRPVKK